MGLVLKPGTDAALAGAVMHVAFRDGHADRAYMAEFADDPAGLEAHLKTRGPNGLPRSPGFRVRRSKLSRDSSGRRRGPISVSAYGFTRQRNGSVAIHAASLRCHGARAPGKHEGGGAFHSKQRHFPAGQRELVGSTFTIRMCAMLDQSQIGRVLTGRRRGASPSRSRDGIAHPEHQSGQCRAGAAAGEARLSARRRLRRRARAIHDGHRATRGHRPAGHHVPRATTFIAVADTSMFCSGRKSSSRRRPCAPIFRHRRAGKASRRRRLSRLRDDGTPAYRSIARQLRIGYDEMKERKWLDCQPAFEERISSTVSRIRTAGSASRRIGPVRPRRTGHRRRWGFRAARELPKFPDHVDLIEVADERHPFRLANVAGAVLPQFHLCRNPRPRSRRKAGRKS